MTFTYTNPSKKDTVWIGDVCFKPEASVVKTTRHPSFEQAVKNGTLVLAVSGAAVKPHGGFTILFDRMEHGTVPQPVRNLLAGDKIELPTLTAEGFTFGGWFKDRECTDEWVAATTTVTGNATLYAKWIAGDEPTTLNLEAVATPVATPAAGEVAANTEVALTCATEDAKIFYTVDGTDPSADSTKYTEAIVVSEAVTIKAIAIKEGMTNSEVLEAAYTIKE